MVTVQQIFELDAMPAGAHGGAEALYRAGRPTHGTGGNTNGWELQAFLRGVKAEAREGRSRPVRLTHPLDAAKGDRSNEGHLARTRKLEQRLAKLGVGPAGTDNQIAARSELTATELMWLQRLPQNPQDVSFDDAVRLARMALTASALEPNARMLVESYWQPVGLHHDEQVTRSQLKALTEPRHPTSAAMAAVRELLGSQNPEWSEEVVAGAANEQARDFLDRAYSKYDAEKTRLNADLQRAREAKADRSRTSRTQPA